MVERAGIFDNDLDLKEFTPKQPLKAEPTVEAVRNVAAKANFQSREAPQPAKKVDRRHRTGRNVQINLKVTDSARDLFYEVFDAYRAKDEKVTQGEVFEWAIRALREKAT